MGAILEKCRKKLKRGGGFTLAEVLLAILVLLLLTGIVTEGIPAAKDAYDRVVDAANAEVLLSTVMTELRTELGSAKSFTVVERNGSKELDYYESPSMRCYCRLENGANGRIIVQPLAAGTGTAPAGHELVSSAAATERLQVEFGKIVCKDGMLSVQGLVVKKNGRVLAGSSEDGEEYTIRLLNKLPDGSGS